MSIVSPPDEEQRFPAEPPDVLSEAGQLCWKLGWFAASDWLEEQAEQEATGSRDFGRGYMHAMRLLRGQG
jgi:hypothetical protein